MREFPCWMIMNCDNHTCVARRHCDQECWELARESEDYRPEFNVCADCLVLVLKTGKVPLSQPDLALIAGGRGCPLAR